MKQCGDRKYAANVSLS